MNTKWLIQFLLVTFTVLIFASPSSNTTNAQATKAATSAQGGQPPALPVKVLTLQFSAAPTEQPVVEIVQDALVFKANPAGKVSGDLEGAFAERITQVGSASDTQVNTLNWVIPITTFFTIKTSTGTIEGYYWGTFYFPAQVYPDAVVHQHGQVLSVTAAYANLYLAEVYYDGVVDFAEKGGNKVPLGDSGTLIIAPR